MEKIKPIKGKSSISSLRFQQKSDFKRFLNFIKNETEELKGIAEPKENKVQGILGAGATGLGILGIGALLLGGGKGEGDDLETAKGLDGGLDVFAAIGRRNVPGVKPTRTIIPSSVNFEQEAPFDKGTRTRSIREKQFTEAKPTEAEKEAIKKRSEDKRIKKRFTYNRLREKSKVGANLAEVGETNKIEYRNRRIIKKSFKAPEGTPRKIDKGFTTIINPKPGEEEASRKLINQKKLTQRTFGRFIKDKNFRRDTARASDQAFLNMMDDPRLKDIESDPKGNKIRTGIEKETGTKIKDFKTDRFTRRSTRPGVNTFSNRDPFGRITDTLSKRSFESKGPLAKLTRKLLRGNAKITKDTFLGISYKGPKFSMLAKAVNNPAAKVIFFGIDLLNTFRAGGQVFNSRDNLAVSLYDLYVSINNSIFKDDPEKLKLYQSISSNEKIMVKQVRRNAEIMRRQNEAVQKKFLEATGKGSNNIIVVPQSNNQGGGAGGGNTKMLSPTGGNGISFVPFEPLNIGDDILLHKLNQ
tara:strand:- start:434 stop:2011 length:1578 start_codon:yes stop_codon:yes gene_type:complete